MGARGLETRGACRGTSCRKDQRVQRRPGGRNYIGGMRKPHKAFKKMTILQEAGNDVARLWNGVAKDLPQALDVV